MGRWRSGAPLALTPDRDDPALGADPELNNDFTYTADPDGRRVPRGAHMRRMNPRDGAMTVLVDVNLHRIIRRSKTYGAPYAACRRTAPPSPSRVIRSGVDSTASRRSTSCAAGSTSSCRPCRR